ncbi:MAG TPA: hypothetical protein VF821_12975, partial [Lentzea sp.]
QTTMAATVSGARTGQFVEKLLQGGYSEQTPVVVAYKVSQADELVVHTTVGELESVVKKHKLYRPTLFLVGAAVKQPTRRVSTSATTSVDEPIRAARPTRWSRRAAARVSTRVDEPVPTAPAAPVAEPNPAWTAVEEIQQSVRKPAEEAAPVPAPKPKLTVVAAEKPKPPTVRASTAAAKKKPAARKPKRPAN